MTQNMSVLTVPIEAGGLNCPTETLNTFSGVCVSHIRTKRDVIGYVHMSFWVPKA